VLWCLVGPGCLVPAISHHCKSTLYTVNLHYFLGKITTFVVIVDQKWRHHFLRMGILVIIQKTNLRSKNIILQNETWIRCMTSFKDIRPTTFYKLFFKVRDYICNLLQNLLWNNRFNNAFGNVFLRPSFSTCYTCSMSQHWCCILVHKCNINVATFGQIGPVWHVEKHGLSIPIWTL
jgi:hypothetical protein